MQVPQTTGVPPGSYRWPWFLLAGVILGFVLAIIWMSYAVKRTRLIRDLNSPSNAISVHP